MKRIFDFLISAIALVLLSPLLISVALLIRCRLGHPVFFRQLRPGLHAKPFEIIKFRTMMNATGSSDSTLPDEARLTKLGRILRETSIDELPEFVNVLRGEMSLVGPRPLLIDYLEYYTAEENRRHEVRPGITGWAQVKGRNSLSWEEKFSLDVWYVDHQSFWLDLKILFMTVAKVIKRDDISAEGHATMPPFRR